MPDTRPDADSILDQALALAAAGSWEALRLYQVADALGVGLAAIHAHYRQKDDLVEALFDRADRAMLAAARPQGFGGWPYRARFEHVLNVWIEALAPYRALLPDMLAYKLEPGHLHLHVQGLLRISRTVQWLREAARSDAAGLPRIAGEVADTALYLRRFTAWLAGTRLPAAVPPDRAGKSAG